MSRNFVCHQVGKRQKRKHCSDSARFRLSYENTLFPSPYFGPCLEVKKQQSVWWENRLKKMKKSDKKDRHANSNKFDLVSELDLVDMLFIPSFSQDFRCWPTLLIAGTFVPISMPGHIRWWACVHLSKGPEPPIEAERTDQRRGMNP